MTRVSPARQLGLPTTELASYSAAMTTTTQPYRGLPGFALDDTPAASSPPDPTQSLRENLELVDDLTRFAEGGLLSESAIPLAAVFGQLNIFLGGGHLISRPDRFAGFGYLAGGKARSGRGRVRPWLDRSPYF